MLLLLLLVVLLLAAVSADTATAPEPATGFCPFGLPGVALGRHTCALLFWEIADKGSLSWLPVSR